MKIFKISSVDMKITKVKLLNEARRLNTPYEYDGSKMTAFDMHDPLNLHGKSENRSGNMFEIMDNYEGEGYVELDDKGISELVRLINESKRTILHMMVENPEGHYGELETKYIVGAKKGPASHDKKTIALKLYAKNYTEHNVRKLIKGERPNKSAVYLTAEYDSSIYKYAKIVDWYGGVMDIQFYFDADEPGEEYIQLSGMENYPARV